MVWFVWDWKVELNVVVKILVVDVIEDSKEFEIFDFILV